MQDNYTVLIPLTNGGHALVDAADAPTMTTRLWRPGYPTVLERKWRRDAYGYAISGGGNRTLKMHRVIMDAPPDLEVDHINGDKLDNRRANLRLVTHQQNSVGRGVRASNKTGFQGVSFYEYSGGSCFRAYIRVNGKQLHIGHFDTAEEAARAYDDAAVAEWGEFAKLNFPGV